MSEMVRQLKDKLSIVDVVSQYVKLERSGQSMRARCPFHAERTPSFFVSPERGTYHCFGCGVGGDIFSFVEQLEGLDFKGAMKVLAEKAGVEIVYERGGKEKKDELDRLFDLMDTAAFYYSSRLNDEAEKYLADRGISAATVRAFRLGLSSDAWSEASDYLKSKKFTDKEIVDAGLAKKGDRGLIDKFRNRIMFPIADSAGRVVGFSGRIFGPNASPDAPKYLNSPETPLFHKSRILYGFDRAKLSIRKHNFAVLVEGQMDLLASHRAGWGNTIAVSGTAFTPEHAGLIRRMTDNLVIALDPDAAGIKAAGRAARAALQASLNVKVAQLPEEFDPADLILKKGKDAWSTAIREAKDIIVFLLDVLEQHAKSPDIFRRSVETVVLPFLSDVQSPIAREQYVREIAKRLGVSESAVAEAFRKVPRVDQARTGVSAPAVQPASDNIARIKQAYGILLWQRSLPKPMIDIDTCARDFREAAGTAVVKLMEALGTAEQESLRFASERLYPDAPTIALQWKTLIQIIHRERLSVELKEATMALRKAEKEGDEKVAAEQIAVCKLLTTKLANLHENV